MQGSADVPALPTTPTEEAPADLVTRLTEILTQHRTDTDLIRAAVSRFTGHEKVKVLTPRHDSPVQKLARAIFHSHERGEAPVLMSLGPDATQRALKAIHEARGMFAVKGKMTLIDPIQQDGPGRKGRVHLFWEPQAAEAPSGYNIFRSELAEGPFNLMRDRQHRSLFTATNFLDMDVTNGVPYFYRVEALNPQNAVVWSSPVATASPTEAQLDQEPMRPANLAPGAFLALVGSGQIVTYNTFRVLVFG